MADRSGAFARLLGLEINKPDQPGPHCQRCEQRFAPVLQQTSAGVLSWPAFCRYVGLVEDGILLKLVRPLAASGCSLKRLRYCPERHPLEAFWSRGVSRQPARQQHAAGLSCSLTQHKQACPGSAEHLNPSYCLTASPVQQPAACSLQPCSYVSQPVQKVDEDPGVVKDSSADCMLDIIRSAKEKAAQEKALKSKALEQATKETAEAQVENTPKEQPQGAGS